jgi:hypothetical protein
MRLSPERLGVALLVFAAFAANTPQANAQQNLFNVPNGKITDLGEMFFQQQFNLSRPVGSSNSTFDFGLGKDFELGFNILDVNMYDRLEKSTGPSQVNPDLLLNGQKGFGLVDEVWHLGIGTQMGINPARRSREVRYQAAAWAINEFKLPDERGSLYAGGYYANVAYGGPGDRFGGLFGMEIPIIKDKLHFQADWITGNRDISTVVVGAVIMFPNEWQLSLGAQLPTPRSHNPYGLVLELTRPGIQLFKKKRPSALAED